LHPRIITEVMRPIEFERNNGDEFYLNGIFEFHITRMIEYINQHQDELERVRIDVEYYYRCFKDLISSRCMLSKQILNGGHLC
jgi:hypothetical protein